MLQAVCALRLLQARELAEKGVLCKGAARLLQPDNRQQVLRRGLLGKEPCKGSVLHLSRLLWQRR